MSVSDKIVFIGAGPGSATWGLWLNKAGFNDITIFAVPDHPGLSAKWLAEGKVHCKGKWFTHEVAVTEDLSARGVIKFSTNKEAAFDGAQIIINAANANGDDEVYAMVAELHLTSCRLVCGSPAHLRNVAARLVLTNSGGTDLVEIGGFPFITTSDGADGAIRVRDYKRKLDIAFEGTHPDVRGLMKALVPGAIDQVLSNVGLLCQEINMKLHVPLMLGNKDKLNPDAEQGFSYMDYVTPEIVAWTDGIDDVCQAVAGRLNQKVDRVLENLVAFYGYKSDSLYAWMKRADVPHNETKFFPKSSFHRWLAQDINNGLDVVELLAQKMGIPCEPVSRSFDEAFELNKVDYRNTGKVAKYGLRNKSLEEIIAFIK